MEPDNHLPPLAWFVLTLGNGLGNRQSVLAGLARNRQRANIHSSARACADPTHERFRGQKTERKKEKNVVVDFFSFFPEQEVPIEPSFNARGSKNKNSLPSAPTTSSTRGSRQPPTSVCRFGGGGLPAKENIPRSTEQGPRSLFGDLVRTVDERPAEGDPWQSQGFQQHRRTQAQKGGLCRVGDLPGFVGEGPGRPCRIRLPH
ncbi:uncharacterized protein B0H64DRAFT_87670 [Chaetomium fimeti]|uniref:Uncharacterized protein n=1 Tax=Chaetomium fimeti TaxID=1854472 RepID=A0AAE0HM06_9PEZI|nr:hypothetical protein B0H64DRAFT_87670 [Chaetomium fimeti]